MCTNGSQIHTAQPQTVGDIVPGMELAWLPCDCWSSRSPGTEMLICVWAKDIIWLIEHCTWKLTSANELHDLYQWNCVLSFTWQDFPSLGYWDFSIFLFYWKSDLSRSLWQWIFLFKPRLRLPLTSSWPEELSRSGHGAFACPQAQRCGGCLWSLPLHMHTLDALRGLYFF